MRRVFLLTFAIAALAAMLPTVPLMTGCITINTNDVIYYVTSVVNGVTNIWTTNVPPAVVTPTNPPPVTPTNPPPVVPTNPPAVSGLGCAAMFVDATGSTYTETINTGVTSPQAWAACHGKGWENQYREDILNRLQAVKSKYLVFIVDKWLPLSNPVLRMCLTDMVHPDIPGKHMVPEEGWYERCAAHGITGQIGILRDSPDTGVAISEQAVKDFVAAWKETRYNPVHFMPGLECKRNTSVTDTARQVGWFHAACTNRIIVGDQSVDFLSQVIDATGGNVEVWKEQDTFPLSSVHKLYYSLGLSSVKPVKIHGRLGAPLSDSSFSAYKAQLEQLAQKLKTKLNISIEQARKKVWAGEWWASTKAKRIQYTQDLLAAGFNCGCGDFSQ